MFVVRGIEKFRKVIEENRRRKLTKHKKHLFMKKRSISGDPGGI